MSDKAGPSRVTPPPVRQSALKRPTEDAKKKGEARPVTPPKAGSPVTPPKEVVAADPGSGVSPKATPKSPPPVGLSPTSSPTTPPASPREKSESQSPGAGSAGDGARKKSRSPLGRRPQGSKQRAKFAKGQFGDQRVSFANPIDNRSTKGDTGKGGGKGKDKQKGKGKSKNKWKKGKQKNKDKDQRQGNRGQDRDSPPRDRGEDKKKK